MSSLNIQKVINWILAQWKKFKKNYLKTKTKKKTLFCFFSFFFSDKGEKKRKTSHSSYYGI